MADEHTDPGFDPEQEAEEERPSGNVREKPGLAFEQPLAFETEGEAELLLELVLIRHGHTLWNRERRYLGSTDLPLLPESKAELAKLRKQPELAGGFWRVCSSDLRRCRETLEVIAPHLAQAAIHDSRLREMSFGAWEGLVYGQLQHNPRYRRWIDDPAAVTPPGGEAWAAFTERVEGFVSGLLQSAAAASRLENGGEPPHLRALIVTHGGVIRQLLTKIAARSSFRDTAAPLPGTAVTVRLMLQGGQWRFPAQ
ncbi:histidine phosphatase family protein [Paenibacillus sp. S150]|uniref:histidine phosphatase family protein n=1 Tax=Paenibacillus sp. S150 TaxID=2749826 RepID=UPI001C5A5048|nr:histidine phosphatase family protein [Paenibacillus sp. S150]MBW4083480.1 histidine phosphatase family protein [Paenibacillus sp. S150]